MPLSSAPAAAPFDLLVLVASAAHLEVVKAVLASLPSPLSLPVLIAASGNLQEGMPGLEDHPIRNLRHDTVLEPGGLYVTPPHTAAELQPGLHITLMRGTASTTPGHLDQLLTSVARSAGQRTLVVVLGGEGPDGLAGIRAVQAAGGTVLVGRAEDARPGLPSALMADGPATLALSTGTLGPVVADLLGEPPGEAPAQSESEQLAALRESEEKYRKIFENIDQGFSIHELLIDESGHVTDVVLREVNEAFERHTGIKNAQGKKVSEIVPHLEPVWLEAMTRAYKYGETQNFEAYNVDTDRWIVSQYSRIGGAGSRLLSTVFTDVTERKQREQHQAFLLKLSDALRSEADADAVALRATAMLGDELKLDRCYVTHFRPDGDQADIPYQMGSDRVPPLPDSIRLSDFPGAYKHVREQTFVLNDDLAPQGWSEAELANSRALGMRAVVATAARKGAGHSLSSLVAVSARPRRWTPGEVTLVEEVAERTWAAMTRAREEALRRQAEELNASLVHFADAVRELADPGAVAETACRLAAERLGVERAYWAEVDWTTHEYVIGASVHTPGVPVIEGRFPMGAWEPLATLHRDGLPIVVNDTQTDVRLPPEVKAGYAQIAVGADLAVPVVLGGTLRCTLVVNQGQPRRWNEAEVALVQGLAGRCWSEVQRARAEAAVRESEARFRAVANLVPDLLWESRPAGFTSWCNQRWLEYTGQTFEQATGWGWTDAIHEADRAGSANRYRASAEAGRPLWQEHRIRRHDGTYRWYVVYTVPVLGEQGEVVRVYGAATDIHDLREHAAELEARVAERTRRLTELNAELMARTRALEGFAHLTRDLGLDTDRTVLIRRAQELVMSLLPEGFAAYYEPEGDVWRLHSQVGATRNPALQALMDAGLPLNSPSFIHPFRSGQAEYQAAYVPGTDTAAELAEHVHSTAALPVRLGGAPLGLFAVVQFTDRMWTPADRALLETVVHHLNLALDRAEAVRRLAEEREALRAFVRFTELTADTSDVVTLSRHAAEVLHATLNVRSAAYFVLDGGRWRAQYVSGAAEPSMGAAVTAGLPASTPSLALPAERRVPMFFESWEAEADGFPPEAAAYRAVARYPLFPLNLPVGVLGMATVDRPTWTDREKAVFRAVGDSFRLALERAAQVQQIAQQRERLADLNAEVGTLITRTAHNLEAPAQRLSLLVNAEPGAAADLPAEDPALLRDEITRLRGVAGDLRQLSSLEAHPLNMELLPLGELFVEVRAAWAVRAGSANGVNWLISPLPIIRGDRTLLRQALEVLMTFTLSPTRGARYVTVDSEAVGGEVQVTVEDDGVWLASEEAATLFDVAVRSDQGVPLLEGGGLIQVRRVLARHGGWAWAESISSGGKIVLAFPQDAAVGELEALFRRN
jgi:PAS domain S-box-containing protein